MSGEVVKDMRKNSNATKYAVTVPWPFIVACALAALVLGLLGFWVESGCSQPVNNCNYIVTLNDIWRTLSLILSAGEIQVRQNINIYLVLARLFAVLFAMGAIFRVVVEFLGDRFTSFRARRREVHTIIVGCGERGEHFLCDCQGNSTDKPVVLDRLNDPAIFQSARDAGALFLQGDARNSTLLADAGLACAKRLIILGGEDTQNLEVLAAAQTVVRKEAEPLQVVVRIDNPLLVRQLERDDDFARGPGFDVTAFNLAATTARCFFRAHPLVDQAEIRAQGKFIRLLSTVESVANIFFANVKGTRLINRSYLIA